MSQKTLYSRYTHRRPDYITNYYDYMSNPAVMARLNDRQALLPAKLDENNGLYRFRDGFRDLAAWYSPGDILGDAWHSLSYMYNLIFNEGVTAETFTEQDAAKLIHATYSQWYSALSKCKSQDCVDQIKQVLTQIWGQTLPGSEAFSDTEYLKLMNYQPSIWWNTYKWFIIGGGVGLGLIVSLGLTAKIMK